MRRHLRNPWVWAAAIVVLVAWLLWPRTVQSPAPAEVPPAATAPASGGVASIDTARTETTRKATPALPPEAYRTLALIARGGPFPHRQDGQVFANREGLLPAKPRGYYHEYTVETPAAGDRGARRIVTGGQPPETWYYTDDHYASFRPFDGHAAASRAQ